MHFLFEIAIQNVSFNIHLINMPFVLYINGRNHFDCIHMCYTCKSFIEFYVKLLCEPSYDHSFLLLLYIPIIILLCLINPFDTNYILILVDLPAPMCGPSQCILFLDPWLVLIRILRQLPHMLEDHLFEKLMQKKRE